MGTQFVTTAVAPAKPPARRRAGDGASAPVDRVSAYARDVLAGNIVAGEMVRLACERHLGDLASGAARGLRWNLGLADRAIDFFGHLRQSKGRWAGKPLTLLPWQQFVVGATFGWQVQRGSCGGCESWLRVAPDGLVACIQCGTVEAPLRAAPTETRWLRRFRQCWCEVAKKNGKTTLAAGLAHYLFDYDDEPVAEVYIAATKRDQARLTWDECDRMVLQTPALRRRIRSVPSTAHLYVQETGSKMVALGADKDSTDGVNPSANIIDEVHRHKSRELVDILVQSAVTREQPLSVYITTAGVEGESIYNELHDYSELVARGLVVDDEFFSYIATLDPEDDWRDPNVYIKGNPSQGVTVQLEELIQERDRAIEKPGSQANYKRLRLNVLTGQDETWLDLGQWDACVASRLERSGRCAVGLDLGGNRDLSAAAVVTLDPGGGMDVDVRFWMPADRVEEAEKRDGVPYRAWAEQGHLTLTAGNYRDDVALLADVYELGSESGAEEVDIDAWQYGYIATQLLDRGVEAVKVPQTFGELGPASEALVTALAARKLSHLGNPLMRWMVTNASADVHPDGTKKPSKRGALKHRKRIDGLSALVTALARLLRMQAPEEHAVQIFIPGGDDV